MGPTMPDDRRPPSDERRGVRRRLLRVGMNLAALAVAACGSAGTAPQSPNTSPASLTPGACATGSPPARAPIGAAQALSIIEVHVLSAVATSSGVLDVGTTTCIDVGVSQVVSLHVHARVPPLPAEAAASPALLSPISVSPAATPTPVAGDFTLTFTARRTGSTVITFLSATCNLPPGVC